MANGRLGRKDAPDPLRVQFFTAVGLATVLTVTLLGGTLSNAIACGLETPEQSPSIESTPTL